MSNRDLYTFFDVLFRFRPNYTSDEIHEILTLNTNIGLMIYPLLVRIPSRVLLACDRTIARPTWEWRTYCLYSCFVICCIVLIRSAAPYNTHLWFFDVNDIERVCEKISSI